LDKYTSLFSAQGETINTFYLLWSGVCDYQFIIVD